jgi:hypothetical protein
MFSKYGVEPEGTEPSLALLRTKAENEIARRVMREEEGKVRGRITTGATARITARAPARNIDVDRPWEFSTMPTLLYRSFGMRNPVSCFLFSPLFLYLIRQTEIQAEK